MNSALLEQQQQQQQVKNSPEVVFVAIAALFRSYTRGQKSKTRVVGVFG